jgi:hypothetical protein
MKARKTVNVSKVLDVANKLLALPESEDHNASFRAGVASVLGAVLFDANAYAGFNYLAWVQGGFEQWKKDNEALGASASEPVISTEAYLGDQTRRFYYTHSSLGAAKLASAAQNAFQLTGQNR